jgi:hypothetical protein
LKLYGFRHVYVFDISQTEGKELPQLTEVMGEVGGDSSWRKAITRYPWLAVFCATNVRNYSATRLGRFPDRFKFGAACFATEILANRAIRPQ